MKTKVNKTKTKNYYTKNIQKPFLKWVGGKTQLLEKILKKIPNSIENYFELFLGGGSVLLAVLSLQKQGKIAIKNKIYAYDVNENLINVYKNVKNNKDKLYSIIETYKNEYNKCPPGEKGKNNRKPENLEQAKTSKESYYYWLRKKFNSMNKNTIEYSALFIVLNKLCFRGVYREGPNGFNVPYGHPKKTPEIITQEKLNNISDLIQNVTFNALGFQKSIKNINNGDFVYLDPPYAPENTNSFVGYVKDGFNLDMHKLLFKEIKNFDNIKFLLSNSKVKLVTDNFKEYTIEDVRARRAINSKNPGATTTEVLIYN